MGIIIYFLRQKCPACKAAKGLISMLEVVKRRRLSLFGHIVHIDEEADANRILFEPLPELWRRPPGRPHSTWLKNINNDLTSFDMELLEARDAAQN